MKRRRFVRGSFGLGAAASFAGCILGGNNAPPPRKSKVFDDVALQGTMLQIQLRSDVEVESRLDNQSGLNASGAVAALSPVGVARAAKGAGGRGTGGYSSAPKHPRHGWAVWHGGGYSDDWREDHRDEIRMYDATVATLAVAHLGTDEEYENDTPGPGPGDVNWDKTVENPQDGADMGADLAAISPGSGVAKGWYRVGTELVSQDGSENFGWQAVDMEIDRNGDTVQMDEVWYVKPRV